MEREQLQKRLEDRIEQLLGTGKQKDDEGKWARKREAVKNRKAEIVRVKAAGKVMNESSQEHETWLDYQVHIQYLIKQGELFYLEEELEQRRALFSRGILAEDWEIQPVSVEKGPGVRTADTEPARLAYHYDRLKAVQYAERWWNEYNSAYPKFTDDCSSFISQCLHAGGIPMWGSPNRNKGWWMDGKSWSYSWTVANALQQLLQSGNGIRTKRVNSPEQLELGDIVCLDFQGDGRFDHSLIVTAKDQNGMPLVNAHTTNSRHRYWAYEDSSAYTPNIVYRFYVILDGT